ncbi:GAF domain-containing protein [Thiorhodococcus mannitoliphagus]|uniref:GAF domain-containing protein n=1 Tax=Thiorhodococcus mannitoliphagus TaxID=329406 RepID=A0A6P1DRH0_9GAMM|nr:GAF domain-containing protein [Thiorhodococcus mannitoliphagus]NEX20847.1 GAF domain-containing protein [Thiorhodococcus mannitoliphagus]
MSELSLQGFLAECEREQLHLAQSIQPFGCLIGGQSGDSRICFVSANVEEWTGHSADALLGHPFSNFLPDFPPKTELADVAATPDAWMQPTPEKRLYPKLLTGPSGDLDGLLSCNASNWLLELEASLPPTLEREAYRLVPHRLYRMPYTEHDWIAQCQYLADELRAVTGFERVMIYRFRPDGCGEVISESLADTLPPYLGLRYPASDIPQIARQLYLSNRHRQIPDVESTTVPILSHQGALADLSLADLRAVSPVHVQYLKNMGVTASLSFSIILSGQLWGLVACYNSTPSNLHLAVRERCAEMTQVFTLSIGGYQSTRRLLELSESDQDVADLIEALRLAHAGQAFIPEASMDRGEHLGPTLGRSLLSLVGAAGATLIEGNSIYSFGSAPERDAVREVYQWLCEQHEAPLFATDALSKHYEPAAAFVSRASGLLAVRIRQSEDSAASAFLWWRPEQPQCVHWAGDPRKSAMFDAQSNTLSPRSSFERWIETTSGHAEPWTDADLLRAKKFRSLVLRDLNASLLRA